MEETQTIDMIKKKITEEQTLSLVDIKLNSSEFDEVFELIAEHNLEKIHIENFRASSLDWMDLFKILLEYQLDVKELSMVNCPFHRNKKLIQLLKQYAIQLPLLESLDLSKNRFNTLDYGIIMNVLKKQERDIKVNLKNCPFSVREEKYFFNFLQKHIFAKNIVFDDENFSQEGKKSMIEVISRNKDNNMEQSVFVSKISMIQRRKQQQGSKKPVVVVTSFSTAEKAKKPPKMLVKCACERQMSTHDMFNCNTCSKSICKFCTDNTINCYTCFSCSKSINPAIVNARTTSSNRCSSCLQCPICFNILSNHKAQGSNKKYSFFFYCKFCFWNSKLYGMVCETSNQLVNGNFEKTESLKKALQSVLKDAFEMQKKLSIQKNKYQLEKDLEREFAKRNEMESKIKKDENMNELVHNGYRMMFQTKPKRYTVFREKTIKDEFEHFLFSNFYSSENKMTSCSDVYDSYKHNSFNLKLFENFPLIVYRSKNDFLIPQNKLNIYLTKNCKPCTKMLASYELKSESVETKINSFYNDSNPSYEIQSITRMEEEEKFKVVLRVDNYTKFKFKLLLKCKNNCEFLNGMEEIEHNFKANLDLVRSIVNRNTVEGNENQDFLNLEIIFTLNNLEDIVYFSFTQIKTLELQNETVITDEFIVKFGDIFEFDEYVKGGVNKTLYV